MTLRQRAEAVVAKYEEHISSMTQHDRRRLIGLIEQCLTEAISAHTSVLKGLEQAATGQGKYIGSFAQYADSEVERCRYP